MDKTNSHPQEGERIAKVMARAGVCSRREAERWIAAGRVSVDGKVIESPVCIVTKNNSVTVDGALLSRPQRTRLWLYHKPRGVLVSNGDPKGRETIFDILPAHLPRVITVGRLDLNSEGLLLLTNDGELARYLCLPKTGLTRIYRARAYGVPNPRKLKQIERGVTIEGVSYAPAQIKSKLHEDQSGRHTNQWFTVELVEGKNREVRKLFTYAELTVSRLIRTNFGPYALADLPVGEVREVTTRLPDFTTKTKGE